MVGRSNASGNGQGRWQTSPCGTMRRMDPRQAGARFEAWCSTLINSIWPHLVHARNQLVAAQHGPEPDAAIDRIEQLLRASIEPVFLQAEMALEPIRTAYDRWIEGKEDPTEQMQELQTRMGEAIDKYRDWTERKVASLVAQARAQELMPLQAPQPASPQAPAAQPSAPASPAQQPAIAFCSACGARVTPEMVRRGVCGSCGEVP
jgi:hypothetical protein